MTPLEQAIDKLPDGYDRDLCKETLKKFPHDEWFTPVNKDGNDYSICDDLHYFHVISKKISPLWHNGSFKGINAQFRYKHDLNY